MKKFKLIVGVVALFALVVANVWNAATVQNVTSLEVINVENVADGVEWSLGNLNEKGIWKQMYTNVVGVYTPSGTPATKDERYFGDVVYIVDGYDDCIPDDIFEICKPGTSRKRTIGLTKVDGHYVVSENITNSRIGYSNLWLPFQN